MCKNRQETFQSVPTVVYIVLPTLINALQPFNEMRYFNDRVGRNVGSSPGVGHKNNEKSVAGRVEYSQNATLVFMSAYSVYVFNGKIRTSHALRSRTLLLRNNDTAVDTIVSAAVYDLATAFNFDTMQRYPNERCILIFPVFISRLTIFGCLTIATFEPTRTTTIFDTK